MTRVTGVQTGTAVLAADAVLFIALIVLFVYPVNRDSGERRTIERTLSRLQKEDTFRSDPAAARTILGAAGFRVRELGLGRDAIVEATAVRRMGEVRVLYVCFRPVVPWTGRQIWAHAYPPESHNYVDLAPVPPPIGRLRRGELGCQRFEMPPQGRFNVYVGVAKEGTLGPAYPFGWLE